MSRNSAADLKHNPHKGSKQTSPSNDTYLLSSEDMVTFNTEKMCHDEKCPHNQWKHRHSTDQCKQHYFCAQPPLKGMDGTSKDQPEKMAMFGSRDLLDSKKLKAKIYKGNKYIGFEEVLKNANSKGYFGHNKEIPKSRKLIVTEEVMDSWLASHWGLSLDNIPPNKPAGMDRYIHDKLKKQFFGSDSLFQADKRKKQKKSDDQQKQQSSKLTGQNFQYEVSPSKFNPIFYPKDFNIQSYVGKIHSHYEKDPKVTSKKAKRDRSTHKPESSQNLIPPRPKLQTQISFSGAPINIRIRRSRDDDSSSRQISKVTEEDEASQRTASKQHHHAKEEAEKVKRFKMRAKSSVALSSSRLYKLPGRYIRNRINSTSLNTFMNYQEIERAAKRLQHSRNQRLQPEKSGQSFPSYKATTQIINGIQTSMYPVLSMSPTRSKKTAKSPEPATVAAHKEIQKELKPPEPAIISSQVDIQNSPPPKTPKKEESGKEQGTAKQASPQNLSILDDLSKSVAKETILFTQKDRAAEYLSHSRAKSRLNTSQLAKMQSIQKSLQFQRLNVNKSDIQFAPKTCKAGSISEPLEEQAKKAAAAGPIKVKSPTQKQLLHKQCSRVHEIKAKHKIYHEAKALDCIQFYMNHLQEDTAKNLNFKNFTFSTTKQRSAKIPSRLSSDRNMKKLRLQSATTRNRETMSNLPTEQTKRSGHVQILQHNADQINIKVKGRPFASNKAGSSMAFSNTDYPSTTDMSQMPVSTIPRRIQKNFAQWESTEARLCKKEFSQSGQVCSLNLKELSAANPIEGTMGKIMDSFAEKAKPRPSRQVMNLNRIFSTKGHKSSQRYKKSPFQNNMLQDIVRESPEKQRSQPWPLQGSENDQKSMGPQSQKNDPLMHDTFEGKTSITSSPNHPHLQPPSDKGSPRIVTSIFKQAHRRIKSEQFTSPKSIRKDDKFKVPMDLRNPSLLRDSVSTTLRIKNEKVTSQILLEKQMLQQILNKQFKLDVSKVHLPIYTQMEVLQKELAAKQGRAASMTKKSVPKAQNTSTSMYQSSFMKQSSQSMMS